MRADKMLLSVGVLLSMLLLSGCFGPAQQQVPQGNQQANQNAPQGNVPIAAPGIIITPWGSLSANEVAGKDLECIGRPAGFTRVLYEESDLGFEKETNIVYLKSGNAYEEAKNYVKQKAEACGYKKYQEKSGSVSIQNFQVTNYAYIEYEKGNEILDIDVAAIKNSQDQEYTLLHITKTIEEETEQEPEETIETTPEETVEEEQEAQATGKAAEWDGKLKPLIGNAINAELKLKSAMQMGNVVTLQYSADKQLLAGDLDAIKTAFEAEGYITQMSESDASNGTLVLVKGDTTVTIALEFDSGEIQVMVAESQ